MFYPLKFQPILVERVWGGTTLAQFGKTLPPGKTIGESWEISDRPEAQSIVTNGTWAGQTLHQIISAHGPAMLGTKCRGTDRFPLLIKLLDARERLSLQVHPPAAIAGRLRGEPKTEMWYILDAAPDAHLIAGLKNGITRPAFEKALRSQPDTLADIVHRFPVKAGDVMFVPSGRLHAIDAGLVIVEIQQNSDTTYRVFDWGRPRELHIEQSLASIDFSDHEPAPSRLPVFCEHFRTELLPIAAPYAGHCDGTSFHILCCIAGAAQVNGERLGLGEFMLLPAQLGSYTITGPATLLRTTQ